MRQEERKERSRHEILRAAMEEFGSLGYEKVSMESICTRHHISKGMMYHYYSGKDELFLVCVQQVFDQLKEHVEQELREIKNTDPSHRIHRFFETREEFFLQNPREKMIFDSAMFRAPKHLKQSIQELREPLREMNRLFLRQTVSGLSLRGSVKQEEALRYLESVEHVFWEFAEHYRKEEKTETRTFSQLSEHLLDMLLHGIAN